MHDWKSVLKADPVPWLLDYRNARMQDATDPILSKQDTHGRWTPKNTYNGRFLVNIERKGKPSK